MKYADFINSILESRENIYFENSERHHIVPRCIGGTNEEENLIYLTYREHFIAHKLLAEENPSNHKLCYAYWMMCNMKEDTTPEEYSEARRLISFKGEHNPMYGKSQSDEAKRLIGENTSRCKLGSKDPEETRIRKSIAATGRIKDEAEKMRISINTEIAMQLPEVKEKQLKGIRDYVSRPDYINPMKDRSHRAESIQKMRDNHADVSGSNNPMYNKGYLISGEKNPMYGSHYLWYNDGSRNFRVNETLEDIRLAESQGLVKGMLRKRKED